MIEKTQTLHRHTYYLRFQENPYGTGGLLTVSSRIPKPPKRWRTLRECVDNLLPRGEFFDFISIR